jgi:hypothetical protein
MNNYYKNLRIKDFIFFFEDKTFSKNSLNIIYL